MQKSVTFKELTEQLVKSTLEEIMVNDVPLGEAINSGMLMPVIRCKDCKKNGTSDCAMGYWAYADNVVYMKKKWNTEYDFCSRAERKE